MDPLIHSSQSLVFQDGPLTKKQIISPLNTQWEARAPLRSHTATILHLIKDHILATIQLLFQRFCSPHKLREREQLSATHLDCFMQKFNQEDNGAVFLSPNFSMLEANGRDWNEKDGRSEPYFSRILSNFKENNPKIISENCPVEVPGELRKSLMSADKNILALPINLSTGSGRHWTMIHFNFKEKSISYIDSVKPNRQAEKVNERLQQALSWIKKIDNDPEWKINQNKNDSSQPSILAECKQQDFWNCGIFALHFTALAGKGKTYSEMDSIPFPKMYREIAARRLEVMDHVNKTLNTK